MHHHLTRAAALCLLLALGACGGGSDSPTPPAPNPPAPTPTPAPAPTPAPPATDRIEPYDPALKTKLGALPQAPAPAPVSMPDARISATITLPALPMAKAASVAPMGAPLQIGQGRTIAETATPQQTAALLQWQMADGARQVAALRFVAQGAQGLRLGLDVQALPDDSRLYFSDAQGHTQRVDAAQLTAATQRKLDAGASPATARLYWGPPTVGDEVVLVISIPAHADAQALRLAIPKLSHLILSDAPVPSLMKAASGACETDVACNADYIEEGRSVARLRFVKPDGNAYQCTGTLMNDTASSGTPWLLTANHCISDQATASSLTTDWLLRASSCGASSIDAAHAQRTGGAVLTWTSATSDTTLLRLNDSVPAGVVYAGSYFGASTLPGTAISDVHHPEGDLQKISLGQLSGYDICSAATDQCFSANRTQGTFFSVNWQQGVVEPGSSGSGLFITLGTRRYLIGQLFGGTSSCTNPRGTDYFSRFDMNYSNALHQWLHP